MKKITAPVEIEVPDGYEFERCYDAKMPSQALDGSYMEKILNIRFKKIEPKKVIDLSCIVGSGIDCASGDRAAN